MVALYARVSTAEQVNGSSIDEQLDRMRKYCEAMHWQIFREYVDAGFSGGSTNRPALQELLSDKDKFDRVLVYKLDRLSRSQKDTLRLIEDEFAKNGVGFTSMTENLDTTSPLGIAMIGILAVFAQLEKEQIKERMEMGRTARAKDGKYVGQSRTPVGYDYIDGELRIIDSEAEQVRQVYSLALQGFSYRDICRIMDEAGLRHRYGQWSPTTVQACLQNAIYTGKVAFKKQLYNGNHAPIVTQETFDRVQEVVKKRSEQFVHQHNAGKATSYLGGLLVCARCGAKLYKRADSHTHPVYVCNNRSNALNTAKCDNKRWPVAELDNIIFEQVRSLRLDTTAMKRREIKRTSPADEIEKIDKQMSRLLDLYSLGRFDMQVLQAKVADLASRKNALAQVKEQPQTDVVAVVKSFDNILEKGDFREIRAVLQDLIDYIEVDGDNLDIHWKF